MIGQRYHEAKVAVLDVCARYLRFRGDTEDGVDVNFLKTRIKEVEDGRYVLAVVGEAKAGKSTLINVLLGERILPTGVLQTSSAIVEIFKSEKKYAEIRYADGHTETVRGDEVSKRLQEVGAIQDRYRSIPTVLIDADIVAEKIRPSRSLPIAELEEKSGLRLQDKELIIQEYVESRSLTDIPKQITFGFPLKYAFDGLRLVDSPGVNAVGGLQDATHEYIREANAVLFVHSLDSQVESGSFHNFINKVVPEHTWETLFLVLTKSGRNSSDDIDIKVREARRLCAKEIDQDRILHVDSLLKIVSDEIKEFDSAASLKKHYRQQEQDCKAAKRGDEASTFEAKRRLLTNVLDDIDDDPDHKTVQAELRKLSNFDEMERLIDDFSSRAPWIQLSNLLRSVKSGYDNQTAQYEQNIAAWEKKRKRPQIFENEISKIQNHLEKYKELMNKFVEKVRKDFTGREDSKARKAPKVLYNKEFEKIKNEHSKRLMTAMSLDAAKRELENFCNAIGSLGDDVTAKIRTRFEEELKRLGKEFKAKHRITVPTIDISAIELKTKEKAYIKYDVPRSPKGAWEWTQKIVTVGLKKFTEKKERYSHSKHLSDFQSEAKKGIQRLSVDFPNLVSSLVENYVRSFQPDLNTLIDSRTRTLEEIKKSKAENDEILKNIERAERKKKDIATQATQINDMLGDIQ